MFGSLCVTGMVVSCVYVMDVYQLYVCGSCVGAVRGSCVSDPLCVCVCVCVCVCDICGRSCALSMIKREGYSSGTSWVFDKDLWND